LTFHLVSPWERDEETDGREAGERGPAGPPLAIGRAGGERHDAEGDDDVKLNDVDVHGVSLSDLSRRPPVAAAMPLGAGACVRCVAPGRAPLPPISRQICRRPSRDRGELPTVRPSTSLATDGNVAPARVVEHVDEVGADPACGRPEGKCQAPTPLGSESPSSTRALNTDSHCSRWT